MKISVVIPVYKNKNMVFKNLSQNIKFLKNCEVIIVDDASGENLTSELITKFKKLFVITNDHNLGFGESVNKGVNKASGDLIMLLNSDVVLLDEAYQKSVTEFEKNNRLFAVSFAQKERGGQIVGKNRLYFKNGLINHSSAQDLFKGLSAWAEGGSCLVRKSYFQNLRGFDRLYAPFYWEDIDLSYRAYKQGWQILFDPSVLVEHHHESTIGSFYSKSFVKRIAFRNQLFFTWKNISDHEFTREHLFFLPLYIFKFIVKGNTEFLFGFIDALKSSFSGLIKRDSDKAKITDKEILNLFN